jgi:hypothetical protein
MEVVNALVFEMVAGTTERTPTCIPPGRPLTGRVALQVLSAICVEVQALGAVANCLSVLALLAEMPETPASEA